MMTFLNTPEAASKLGLSESQMNKMRHFGTGPDFNKFGSAVRYAEDALDRWAAQRSQTCTRADVGAAA